MAELVKKNVVPPLYTVNALVGKLFLECFFSADVFTAVPIEKNILNNSTFTEEHSHSYYELLICKDGAGFQFIDNGAHEYMNNTVILLSPFVPHTHISKLDYPETRYSIAFELSKKQIFDMGNNDVVVSSLHHLNKQGYFMFTADDHLMRLVDLLKDAIVSNNTYSELSIGGLLSALLSNIFCIYSDYSSKVSDSFPERWDKTDGPDQCHFLIDYYFNQLCNKNIKMEDICARVHLSPAQLNRMVKDTYGITYKQKLIEARIAYIKYFLQYSDLTINEIADRLDFMESSNFSLFFKQHCGETPSQYRARTKEQGAQLSQSVG